MAPRSDIASRVINSYYTRRFTPDLSGARLCNVASTRREHIKNPERNQSHECYRGTYSNTHGGQELTEGSHCELRQSVWEAFPDMPLELISVSEIGVGSVLHRVLAGQKSIASRLLPKIESTNS